MGQLKAVVLVVLVTAAIARNVNRPDLKQIPRASRMTRTWRADSGVGSFNDVGTAGGNTLTKPKVLQCTEAGYFPQPGSCTDFYRCVDWTGSGKFFSTFRFNCPYGTVFDDDLDICNHPAAVRNPPECAGAMGKFPLPEPPGVDSQTESGGLTDSGGTGTSGSNTDDTKPCNGTLAPDPIPETTTVKDVIETTLQPGFFDTPTTGIETTLQPFFVTTPGVIVTTLPPFVEEYTTFPPPMEEDTTFPPVVVEDTTFPVFIETTTAGSMWEVDESSLYACRTPGYYPFEGDCIRFYKCVETDAGTLKGLLYKCPTGYGYSEERKRCWPEDELPPCQRKIQVAHERFETATPIYPEDLIWFFNNKK